MLKTLKTLALILVLCSLLTAAPLTFAQEETAAETSSTETTSGNIPGASVAILFLGGGAIVVVGMFMLARDNFRSDTE